MYDSTFSHLAGNRVHFVPSVPLYHFVHLRTKLPKDFFLDWNFYDSLTHRTRFSIPMRYFSIVSYVNTCLTDEHDRYARILRLLPCF